MGDVKSKPANEAKPASEKAPAFTVSQDGSRVRQLLRPIEGHTAPLSAIKLRKPRYLEIMAYGDPCSLILMAGSALPHEDMDIVRKYLEALSVDMSGEKIDPTLLEQLDYVDALALKDAVTSFFK